MKLKKIIPIVFFLGLLTAGLAKTGIISEEIISAYQGRETSAASDVSQLGGRSDIWLDAVHQLATHPFGWERVRYAHNLWLDIARIGGWFALLLFLIVTFNWFKSCLRLTRKTLTPFVLIVLSLNTAMFLSSCVEPVIEGSMLFFSLLMMIWGVTANLSKEIECK